MLGLAGGFQNVLNAEPPGAHCASAGCSNGSWKRSNPLVCLVFVAILLLPMLCGGSDPVLAETMRSALTTAYANSPELDAERARLRAVDEDVQRARSGWGPRINGSASIGSQFTAGSGIGRETDRTGDIGVDLTQPLFTGFRTYNAVNEAEATVRAGRAQLRDIEGRVLVDVAQAYLDVIRDRELVALAEAIVRVYANVLSGSQRRLGVGEVTRTDVAQAESRRADGLALLEEAKGELRRSEARYNEVVGRPVGQLSTKNLLLGKLPATTEAGSAQARAENALVERALYLEQAARFAVSKERSEFMPRVDLEAGYNRSYSSASVSERTDTAEIVGRLLVPLYQGGEVRARVRQVKHLHVSRLQEIEQVRRGAVSDFRVAWATLQAAQRQLLADGRRISFLQKALTGVRDEERVGQRTLLDVLNAEQEVFQAQTRLVRASRDRHLAHYQVLQAVGRLDADFLSLADVQYDPTAHYHEAKEKWLTTSIGHKRKSATQSVAVAAWAPAITVAAAKTRNGWGAVARSPTNDAPVAKKRVRGPSHRTAKKAAPSKPGAWPNVLELRR